MTTPLRPLPSSAPAPWATASRTPPPPRATPRRLYDVSAAQLAKASGVIAGILAKSVELGKLAAADAEAARGRLTTTTSVAEAVRDAAVVIEAAPEKMDLKLALLAEVQARGAGRRGDRLEHLGAQHHRDGRGPRPPRPPGRHALLQSRAQDEAGRDRARARDERRDRGGDAGGGGGDGEGDGAHPRVAGLHHQPHQRHDRQRSVLHAAGGRRLGAATSTRR